MPYIRKLNDPSGKTFYPVTVSEAVAVENNKSLKTKLNEIQANINTAINLGYLNVIRLNDTDFREYVTTIANVHHKFREEFNVYRFFANEFANYHLPCVDSHILVFSIDSNINHIRALAFDIRSKNVYTCAKVGSGDSTWQDWTRLLVAGDTATDPTKVAKTGDTMTGNLTFSGGQRSIGFNSGSITNYPIKFYPGDGAGSGIVINAGGRTIIGGGEAADSLHTAAALGVAAADEAKEELHLASDGLAYVHTQCQDVTKRKTFTFATNGDFTSPGALIGASANIKGAATISGAANVAGLARFTQGTAVTDVLRGTSGSAGYTHVAKLTINDTYTNSPIEMSISQRGKPTPMCLFIQFANQNDHDPSLVSFKYTGTDYEAWIHKAAASVWDIYVKKSESYDQFVVNRLHDPSFGRIKITEQHVRLRCPAILCRKPVVPSQAMPSQCQPIVLQRVSGILSFKIMPVLL